MHSPRKQNAFPTTLGGKAFDTGLVMPWPETECDASKAFGDFTIEFTFHLQYLHFVGMFKTLFGGCAMAFEVLYHA